MASFYIGQRVRIIGVIYKENARLIGQVGTLVDTDLGDNGQLGWIVDLDSEGVRLTADGRPKLSMPEHLAPISDSNQLSSWEAMKELNLWVPDEMRAGA